MIRMMRMAGWRYRLPTSPARAKPQRRPRASHQARWPPDGTGGRRRFTRACDRPSARPPRTQPSVKPGSSWDVSYASLKFTAGRQIHYSGDLFGRVGTAFEFGQQADGEGAVAGVEFGTGGCGQMGRDPALQGFGNRFGDGFPGARFEPERNFRAFNGGDQQILEFHVSSAWWLTGPQPRPRPGLARMASWMKRLAWATALLSEAPSARLAVMAAEYVQPVPWVWRVSRRGAGNSRHSTPSNRTSTTSVDWESRWPPLISTAAAPIWWMRQAARRMSSRVRIVMPVRVMPVRISASGTLGVMRAERGSRCSRMADAADSGRSGAPCLLTITGSTTRGNANPAAARATARTISKEPSAPEIG